ncbi:MAG: hypothetical protein AB1792_09520 [Candidatus Zixiibacteriota bacterium]
MRKSMGVLVAVIVLGTLVTAGAMTPGELTTKVANCPSCKAMVNYPELGPSIRADVFETANGYVSTFLMADAKLLPTCAKWEKDCEAAMADGAKLPPAEFDKTFCPVCTGMAKLMARKDVKIEQFNGSMGKIAVASATTKEGVDALHAYVKTTKEVMGVMPQAMAEIMKNAKPKTAASGQ